MKVRIFADVSSDPFGGSKQEFVGEGDTFEAAHEDAIAKVATILRQNHAQVEVGPDCWLPPKLAANLPAMPTPEHTLVVYVSVGHSGGEYYNWRLTAVVRGSIVHSRHDKPERVGRSPLLFSVMDSNSDYSIALPAGSFEYVEGKWVARAELHYTY